MSSNLQYRSRAVRALVLLHEEPLRRFVRSWRLALANSVSLPPTDDPAYASLGALGQHVLGAAGDMQAAHFRSSPSATGNMVGVAITDLE
jgi:hypothetical protein